MATFEYPVPYTATLSFKGKQRKYNVLGTLTTELEELSSSDLELVATWRAAMYRERGNHHPLGNSGVCFWNEGRFLSPILIATEAEEGATFSPLSPAAVRDMLLSRDRVLTYDASFFFSSKPSGYQHDLYRQTLADDGWRPNTLPNGEAVEDTFTSQAHSARKFLNTLVLVDGHLFQITAEPVIGCTFDFERDAVTFQIRTPGNFHEDWEVFRLDKFEDALAYGKERWPNKRVEVLFDPLLIHDENRLSFSDEGYSLAFSARTLIDEAMRKLAHVKKEVGLNVLQLNRLLPNFEEGRPVVPGESVLGQIADKLPSIEPALHPEDRCRLSATINRWHLRPTTSKLSFR
jgi:hypothetical protein